MSNGANMCSTLYKRPWTDTTRGYTGRPSACGGIGRRARLRALWTEWSVEVRVLSGALAGPARLQTKSGSAGHSDFKGGAYLTHPIVAEPAEAFDQNPDRNALD